MSRLPTPPEGWVWRTVTDARGTRRILVPAPDPNSSHPPGRGRLGVWHQVEPRARRRPAGVGVRSGGRAVPVERGIARLRRVLGDRVLLAIRYWRDLHPEGEGQVEINWAHSWVEFHRQFAGEWFMVAFTFADIHREVNLRGVTPQAFSACVDRCLEDVRWSQQGPPATNEGEDGA